MIFRACSRDVSPCYLVSRCPVSCCQPPQFRRSRDVTSRVFSVPVVLRSVIHWLRELLTRSMVTLVDAGAYIYINSVRYVGSNLQPKPVW